MCLLENVPTFRSSLQRLPPYIFVAKYIELRFSHSLQSLETLYTLYSHSFVPLRFEIPHFATTSTSVT